MADTKITEKFEFKTSIITSYVGTEQRVALRSIPRHYLSYDYEAMNGVEALWLRAVLRMKQTTPLYIPMWHNPLPLVVDSLKGNNFIQVEETSMYSLDRCSAVVVFVKDGIHAPNQYYQPTIYSDKGIVGVAPELKASLNKRNAYIYPAIRCSLQPITDLRYIYSSGSSITINFEDLLEESHVKVPDKYLINHFDDYANRNPYSIPETLTGDQVLIQRPQWVDDDSVTLSIEKQTTKVDNDIGVFEYDSKNNLSYDVTKYTMILTNKSDINNMIKFFHRVRGRFKPFYIPSWVNDFVPCFDIKAGATAIYTEFNSLYNYYTKNNRKRKVIIFTKDYHSYIFGIISLTQETIDNKTYGKLLLSSPTPVNLLLDNISMVSYLNYVRLDDDTLQLNYESTQVAQVDITTKEVDDV